MRPQTPSEGPWRVSPDPDGSEGISAISDLRQKRRDQAGAQRGLRLGFNVVLVRAALLFETLLRCLWRAALVVGLFVAVALFDLLPALPGWLHSLLLVGLALALLLALWRGFSEFRWPAAREAARRLELDAGVAHRPLTAIDDQLASGSGNQDSEALWIEHRRRLNADLSRLRAKAPHPVMAGVDPRALRALVAILLVIGVILGHEDWRERLTAALEPNLAMAEIAGPAKIDVWVNPPSYTEVAPMLLDPAPIGDGPALAIPVNSTLLGQVQGGRGVPSLVIDEAEQPFEAITEGTYRLSQELTGGARLAVRQGNSEIAAWSIEVVPDLEPAIEFLAPPGRTDRSILRLDYLAEDDYGLTSVTAQITRIDDPAAEPIELALPLPGSNVRNAENTSFHDLTPHPWAGIAVEIKFQARDAADQLGESDAVRTVLPERIFNHPVARALVELRKQLTLDPTARLPVVKGLAELNRRPAHFFHDIVVSLALRVAERRLIHDGSEAAVPQVQQLMWDTALRIEDGELSIAERDLREIQQQLQEALAEGASDEEIQQLMDALEQAISRFLEALAEQLQEQMAEGQEMQPLGPESQVLDSSELRELLDQARDLAQSGARDAARELLAQLQQILENIRAMPFGQMMTGEGQDALQTLREMEELMQRQQELLDRSHQRSQMGEGRPQQGGEGEGQPQMGQGEQSNRPGQGRTSENAGDAGLQESLRRELGELMRRLGNALGDIPRPLGRAEQAMRDARDALGRNQPGEAIDPQTRAIDQLQQGIQDSAQAFMEQMGPGQGQGQGAVGMQQGPGRDPLGRQTGNGGLEALEGVRIPDRMEIRRAREILDELRRRRGERFRPLPELDYIDRLLQQF